MSGLAPPPDRPRVRRALQQRFPQHFLMRNSMKYRHLDEQLLRFALSSQIPSEAISRSRQQGELFEKDPHTLDLSGCDLSGVDLTQLSFGNALLAGTTFDGASLRGARFSGADLSNCSFRGCSANYAVFNNCTLDHATFMNADFSGADFSGSSIRGAVFTGTRMEQAKLLGVTTHAHCTFFSGANLRGASIGGHLNNSDFRQADLREVTLVDCALSGVVFGGGRFGESNLLGANFNEVVFCDEETRKRIFGQLVRNALSQGAYLRAHNGGKPDLVVIKQKKALDEEPRLLEAISSLTGNPITRGAIAFNTMFRRVEMPEDVSMPQSE
jgi:uncharacterized protein YjbI with pentapeptide repeats